jgi:hypothetical protein
MLERQGINRKKLYRLYKEERLSVRKRGGRKRALGTQAPMVISQGRNLRWSLDFVTDTLVSGRRFRILYAGRRLHQRVPEPGSGHPLSPLYVSCASSIASFRRGAVFA